MTDYDTWKTTDSEGERLSNLDEKFESAKAELVDDLAHAYFHGSQFSKLEISAEMEFDEGDWPTDVTKIRAECQKIADRCETVEDIQKVHKLYRLLPPNA